MRLQTKKPNRSLRPAAVIPRGEATWESDP